MISVAVMTPWIKEILASKTCANIPVLTHPGIEATGHKVIEAVKNGDIHYEAIKYLADKYPTFACCTIMDLTVEAEAFGADVEFNENDLPNVLGRLVYDAESVERLAVPSLEAARVPEYLKACRRAVENIGRPILAGCIGPFSLAGRLYDMSEIMVGIYLEPDVINALLDKCTRFLISYAGELKRLGAKGVFMAEPAAGLLSDDDCRAFSSVYVKRIVDALQDDTFAVILHNCGNTGQCTSAMVDSTAAALHFGNAIDMKGVIDQCPADILVMGNVDPVSIMKQATPEKVKATTKALLEAMGGHSNYVLSTGCDVPPHCPAANIDAYFEALDEYNQSK